MPSDKVLWDYYNFFVFNIILFGFTISADTIKYNIMNAYKKRKTLIKTFLQNAEGKISLTCNA